MNLVGCTLLTGKKRINYFSLFQKHVFIFKMDFGMSFQFENVVLLRNVFSFSKCKRFCKYSFPLSKKHNCKQKSSHSLQIALLMRLWTNNEIYKKLLSLFQFSKIYNLLCLCWQNGWYLSLARWKRLNFRGWGRPQFRPSTARHHCLWRGSSWSWRLVWPQLWSCIDIQLYSRKYFKR